MKLQRIVQGFIGARKVDIVEGTRFAALYAVATLGASLVALEVVAYLVDARCLKDEVPVVALLVASLHAAWAVAGRLRDGFIDRAWEGARPALLRVVWDGVALAGLLALLTTLLLTFRIKLGDARDPRSYADLQFEVVRIPTRDGLVLDGWFVGAEQATRTLLIVHGFGANKSHFLPLLTAVAGRGLNVLMIDLRAHGSSGGRLTTWGIDEQEDVLASVSWLRKQKPRESRCIGGLGASMGALALVRAAAVEPFLEVIVLDSPLYSLRSALVQRLAGTPLAGIEDGFLTAASLWVGRDLLRADAIQAVSEIEERPMLVVRGNDDHLLRDSQALSYYMAAKGIREYWEAAGGHAGVSVHNSGEYGNRVSKFVLHACARPR